MKKGILSLLFLLLAILAKGQTNPVDQMFDKYSEKEGYTTVSISGKMFSMLSELDSDNENTDNIINNLRSIRILSVEDSLLNLRTNFYNELINKLNKNVYEELMVVKKGPNTTKFFVKYNNDRIAELLVIKGGPGGNSLILIKGNLSLKNISDLSKSMDIDELEELEDGSEENQD